jgi:IS5 family transposase
MLIASSTAHQSNLFGTDLIEQLDPKDPLLQLAAVIPWQRFDQSFAKYYAQGIGRPSKPIRLMVGLLILKCRCMIIKPCNCRLRFGLLPFI